MTTINLGKTVTKTIIPAQTTTLSSVTLIAWLDSPSAQMVQANTVEVGNITLWSGEAYVNIGNWTEEQAEAQLISLLTS